MTENERPEEQVAELEAEAIHATRRLNQCETGFAKLVVENGELEARISELEEALREAHRLAFVWGHSSPEIIAIRMALSRGLNALYSTPKKGEE